MQTVNAIMLLLGCSHDAQICEPAELDQPYYETIQQCEGDIAAQRHHSGEGYPITVVKCLEVNKLPANEAVKIQWHFNENGVLIAYAGPINDDRFIDPNAKVLVASSDENTAN